HITYGCVTHLDFRETVKHILPRLSSVFQIALLEQLDRFQGSRTGEWVASIGISMCALGPRHDRFPGNAGTQGQAGGNSLRGGDDIRLDAEMLDRPPLAGST